MLRKRIAVITARADDSEQKNILNGITEAAFAMEADVVVFSNIFNHWINDELLNYENHIFDHFFPEQFSGVIVTAEAFMELDILSDVFERVRASGIPAVMISGTEPGFITVDTSDEADMESIAEHLITVHGLSRIDILTGHKEMTASQRRIAGCRRAFEKHNIPFDEENIFYGDFWNSSGEELGNRYLSGELPLPQAVICTNDYMAFGLCDALTQSEISVPGDVAVTGFDFNEGRIFHSPLLTTFRRDRRSAGAKAVKVILGGESETYSDEDRFISGESCGCRTDSAQLNAELTHARIGQFHTVLSSVAQFSSRLTLCRTLAEYVNVLREFCYLLHNAAGLYFCIDKEWNKAEPSGEEYICCSIGHVSETYDPIHFSRRQLFPALDEPRKAPAVFYVTPLCFQKEEFGYTVMFYNTTDCYDFSFRDWNKTVSNTLEFLRMKNDIHYLTQCQKVSTLYDSLTGFYQADKFRNIIETTEGELSLQVVRLYFTTDTDFLFGENYRSDIVAKTADLIKRSAVRHEVMCRADDDLFLVLCKSHESGIFSEKLRVLIFQEMPGSVSGEQFGITMTDISSDITGRTVDKIIDETRNIVKPPPAAHSDTLPHFSFLSELRRQIIKSPKKVPSTDEICRKLCISDGYFRILYKKFFGTSYVQDCINCKLMLAKYLLITTSMSIYAIALNCGYTDEKYFDRQFRQNAGCSPMQYRARYC